MQKLLQRTVQAEKQAVRRKAKRTDIKARAKLQDEFKHRMNSVALTNQSLKDARRRRREDWELGPLAPRRDTPLKDANGAYWGTSSLSVAMDSFHVRQRNLACQWAGGAKYLCLKVGDRVAIMQGSDKGKIATIRTIRIDEATVSLEGDDLQQNVTLSDYLVSADLGEKTTYTQLSPLRIPIQAVRLVHPLRNEETGIVRDVIINELKPFKFFTDKPTNRTTWSRLVPGLNVVIPWPRAFENAERNKVEQVYEDSACDTPREDVEESTFLPSLLRPPMPAEIIDELRNKYSKFRTRHTAEYIQQKEEEAGATDEAKRRTEAMLWTPKKELQARRAAERAARGEPALSNAMLEKIGELMLRTQQGQTVAQEQLKAQKKMVEAEAKRVVIAKADVHAKLEKLRNYIRYMSKKRRAKEETRLKETEIKLKSMLSELSAQPESSLASTAPRPS